MRELVGNRTHPWRAPQARHPGQRPLHPALPPLATILATQPALARLRAGRVTRIYFAAPNLNPQKRQGQSLRGGRTLPPYTRGHGNLQTLTCKSCANLRTTYTVPAYMKVWTPPPCRSLISIAISREKPDRSMRVLRFWCISVYRARIACSP